MENLKYSVARLKQPQQLIHTKHNRVSVLVKNTTRFISFNRILLALLVSSQCFAETRPIPDGQTMLNQISFGTTDSTIKGAWPIALSKQSGTNSIDSFIQFFSPFSPQIQAMPQPQAEAKSQQTGLESDEWCYLHLLIPFVAFVIGLGIALGR